VTNFPAFAQVAGAKPVVGDFDGDGLSDIALTGGAGWHSIPVARALKEGGFDVHNVTLNDDFPTFAQTANAQPVGGF
jgi:hypothetical protein